MPASRAAQDRLIGEFSMMNTNAPQTPAELRDGSGAPPTVESPRPESSPIGTEPVLHLPEGTIPLLPLRDSVLFPATVLPLEVGRPSSVAAVQHAVKTQGPIGTILQRDPAADEPGQEGLYEIGTVAHVLRYVTRPDGPSHLICRGEQRFRILALIPGYPFLVARVERIAEPADAAGAGTEIEARMLKLRERAVEAI